MALPIIVIVVDNGMYGTIRMHQEREYPGRISATELRNPDFAAYARAFGGFGISVERTEDFPAAFKAAQASGKPAIVPPSRRRPTPRAASKARSSAVPPATWRITRFLARPPAVSSATTRRPKKKRNESSS
jgi:thiamine pyrophosphate-dependent acetolactate synthase large subunit-like protein